MVKHWSYVLYKGFFKSLNNYINEVRLIKDVPGRLHVGGTYSNKLLIFDIDDTLLITDTKVFVTKGGRIVRTLSSAEFNDDVLPPTPLQDFAQIVAYNYCEECAKTTQRRINKTKVVWGIDPCKENDLREIFPAIFNEDVVEYSDYVMMCCPFHQEKHPSLRISKEWFKCYACGEKGNIWTLKKKGLVEFGLNGEVVY